MDRVCSLALFVLALGLACTAVLLWLSGFIDYLQSGRWPVLSLLQVAYDTHVLSPRWFLGNRWSWPLHDALARVPAAAVALALTPVCWWLSSRLARR